MARSWKLISFLLPREVTGVAVRHDLNGLPINRDDIVANRLYISLKDAEGGIILEQVGCLLDTSGVVDGNDVEGGVLPAVPAPEEIPPDPPEPIDGHLDLGLYHSPLVATSTHLHISETERGNPP